MNRTEATITRNDPAGPDARVITFRLPRLPSVPVPGQFFMVRMLEAGFPLFGRAFAVLGFRPEGRAAEVDFLVKRVGLGTTLLCGSAPGDRALLVGPCGNGFPPPSRGARVLMVAGGTGVAAFHYLLERGDVGGEGAVLLYGAPEADRLYLRRALEEGDVDLRVATEDGSTGLHGLATDLLTHALDALPSPDRCVLFACGPEGMMAAAARIARARGLSRVFLSLEGRMACGIGICNGCAVEVVREGRRRYECVCREGPVFGADALVFPDAN